MGTEKRKSEKRCQMVPYPLFSYKGKNEQV